MTKLGQHFLIDHNIARKIIEHSNLNKNDTVIEIGPGKGVLTQYILQHVNELIVIEIDKKLCEFLKEKFNEKIKIIHADFLKVNLNEIVDTNEVKFISNIPYSISSPILAKILPWNNWKEATLMFQYEFAKRIVATSNSKEYSPLSIFTQIYSQPEFLFKVSKNCFRPIPQVDSAVVKLKKIQPLTPNPQNFIKFIKSIFQHRRKNLLNALYYALKLKKEEIKNKLLALNINPDLRPEQLSINELLLLSEILSKN